MCDLTSFSWIYHVEQETDFILFGIRCLSVVRLAGANGLENRKCSDKLRKSDVTRFDRFSIKIKSSFLQRCLHHEIAVLFNKMELTNLCESWTYIEGNLLLVDWFQKVNSLWLVTLTTLWYFKTFEFSRSKLTASKQAVSQSNKSYAIYFLE